MTSSRFELTYYGTGMTPRVHVLPEGTSEELAVEIARNMKADPYAGFQSLKEVREIDLDKPTHNHPTPDQPTYWKWPEGHLVSEDTRWEWQSGCPVCREAK